MNNTPLIFDNPLVIFAVVIIVLGCIAKAINWFARGIETVARKTRKPRR